MVRTPQHIEECASSLTRLPYFSPFYSPEPGPAKPATARPKRPSATTRSHRQRARLRTTPRPRGRHAAHRSERLMAAQDRVHIARQLRPRAAHRSYRHVRSFVLSSLGYEFMNFMFHHDAERTSRTRWWTYRARPSSRPSRIHSLRRAAQSSSAHCGIRRNRVCAPSLRTRCSQTRTCGQTHTTCSGLASGQASAAPRCVFAVSPPCGTTNGACFFSLPLLFCRRCACSWTTLD